MTSITSHVTRLSPYRWVTLLMSWGCIHYDLNEPGKARV